MYECPNCGGNLKFDIPSQQLKCEHCLTMKDPYEVTKEQDAEESSVFDVTMFTCPQCGGEILSTDTSAAEFCSFCGASTILDSRISQEKRPSYIIPFKQTKENCKKAYMARMKRAPFAPDELKDEKCIDSFRGLYVPYWCYDISQQGEVSLKGEKTYRRGNYTYTDYYDLSGHINASYNQISYDASSSFDDNISEQIAPFDVKESRIFTPSFLSGFYADTSDVDSSLYKDDALKLANTTSYSKIKKTPAFADLQLHYDNNNFAMTTALRTWCDTPERVLYPVWFMSYRKGDRVAYATVNGQNGKVAADLPVDLRKYGISSVLLGLPVFVLLNLFFTILPRTLLGISAILALITFFVFVGEIVKIYHRDQRSSDRGYQYRNMDSSAIRRKKAPSDSMPMDKLLSFSKMEGSFPVPGFMGSVIAAAVAAVLWIWNPVSDLWYYAGTIVSLLGILFTVTAIIRKYNILATRKLPQFDRTGGDDLA